MNGGWVGEPIGRPGGIRIFLTERDEFVNSSDPLANIFTKSLQGPRIDYICNKLGTYDLYAPV